MDPRALLMGVALLIGCAAQSTAPALIEPSSDPPASSRQAEPPWADELSKAELRRELMTILSPGPSILLGPMPHEYQRLNNCGPTSVAMMLGYLGQPTSQVETVPVLKGGPWDKNVDPREMAAYFRQRGFQAKVGINGDLELLLTLLANGFPVVVQQWLERPDDALTGHYRVVLGFDQSKQVLIVNDPYLGPQLEISFLDFDRWWRAFNRLYIVVYQQPDQRLVRAILGADSNTAGMYTRAAAVAREEIATLGDAYAWFNLGNAYLGLGRGDEAVSAFAQAIEIGLPERMLWYQFGPFQAYLEAGRYQELLEASAPLIALHPELEELQYLRGMAYLGLERPQEALASLRTALAYNPHFEPALETLNALEPKSSAPSE